MKLTFLIFITITSGVFSLPLSNSDEVRWNLVRDGDGKMRMVDLNPVESEVEPAFDAEADTFFLLFTRDNPLIGQRITWTRESIDQSNFRHGGQVRLLAHGWGSSSTNHENIRHTGEFLALGDFNVIVTDWSIGAGEINYITSRNRVGVTGQVVARLLDFLQDNGYSSHSNVNLIGHSLGAHVVGHAGKNVLRGQINAIFGTDPAGPLFNINNPNDRLDSSDAFYTEAIHTNVGVLGFDEPITHATFYPNWGGAQPGCGIDVSGHCAHTRANFFYSESINSEDFVAVQCASYAEIVARSCPGTGVFGIMGGDRSKTIRGVFLLMTNEESPFAQG